MADADPVKVRRKVLDEMYHIQVGCFYSLPAGEKDKPSYIVAIDRGYNVSVHRLHPNTINSGWEEVQHRIDRLNYCIFANEWHKSYDFWTHINDL
jgi:hypothetical protein